MSSRSDVERQYPSTLGWAWRGGWMRELWDGLMQRRARKIMNRMQGGRGGGRREEALTKAGQWIEVCRGSRLQRKEDKRKGG